MEGKYKIIHNEAHKPVINIDDKLFSFIEDIKWMQGLYKNKRYTHAERVSNELKERLDDLMRNDN